MNNSRKPDFTEFGIVFQKPLRNRAPLYNLELIPFYFFLTQVIKPGCIVELGVCTGNTLAAFCQAVRFLGLPARCYGVDTWKGDIHVGLYDESVYTDLVSYMQTEYGECAQLLRMTFDEALGHFSDYSIDLLHIDGTHTYEAARHDFESWLPRMSNKGVIMLHDTQLKQENFGVWKLWEDISGSYPSWEIDFASGLGVLAVGKDVDEECISFLSEAGKNSFYRDFFFSIGDGLRQSEQLKELGDKVGALESIYRSRGWKALSLYYTIKAFVLGKHS